MNQAIRLFGGVLALCVCMIATGAAAQLPLNTLQTPAAGAAMGTPSLPDPLTPEAAAGLVARLSDADVRALLLDRLEAVALETETAAATSETRPLSDFVGEAAFGVYHTVATAVERLPVLWTRQAESFQRFADTLGLDGLVTLLVALAGAVAAGIAAERLVLGYLRRAGDKIVAEDRSVSLRATLAFLGRRLVFELTGLAVFVAVASAVARIFIPAEASALATVIMINMVALPRLVAAQSRFLISPRKPVYRIVHTDDRTARFLHRHQIGIIALMGLSIALITLNEMNGVPMGETRLGFWLNLAVHVYLIWVVWQARSGLVLMMRGADPNVGPIEAQVARAYPYFAIFVSAGTWVLVSIIAYYELFGLLQQAPHYWMMILLLMAPALDTLVRGMVRHLTPPMTGEGPLAEKAYAATKAAYTRIGRVIVFGLVVLAIGWIWNIDFGNLAASGVGAVMAARLIEVLIVLAMGYLVFEVVALWINRLLAAEHTKAGSPQDEEMGAGEGGAAGGSRLATVLPLLRGVLRVTVLVVFGLIALGTLGIDTTPLLAGAGIIGLAIGFGAQKLVTDVVSGLFFLFDDAFRTGEFVDIEGTMGTVEKISIRSMQLRHHRGAVHTIPYGAIPKLTNYSRDWVIMKLKFTVPFDTDPALIKKLFKQIGKDMMAVPEFAADMMQPFKSQGVFEFNDVGMVVRGKFMAKPGGQFTLRKEIYDRVKRAFDEHGIPFARREVRVALPDAADAKPLTDQQKSALAAAAEQAAEIEAAGDLKPA